MGAHLVDTLHSADSPPTYWRKGEYQVDYVVARGTKHWAIEVKSGRSGKTPGLDLFRARYPEARLLVVGGNGIPLQEFFGTPAGTWLE